MVTDIAQWLRKQPVATVIRCKCVDGQTRMVRVDQKSKRRFVEAEEAIEAMRATEIEALDAKGNTLRMTECPGAPEEGMQVVPAAQSAEQSTLAHFASLLANAYKAGAQSAEKPTQMAFETLGRLLTLVLERLQDVEARQVRQLNSATKAAEDALSRAMRGEPVDDGEGGSLDLGSLVSQFVGGLQMAKQAKGALNGAAEAVADAKGEGDA